jgi:hypothetical protein
MGLCELNVDAHQITFLELFDMYMYYEYKIHGLRCICFLRLYILCTRCQKGSNHNSTRHLASILNAIHFLLLYAFMTHLL